MADVTGSLNVEQAAALLDAGPPEEQDTPAVETESPAEETEAQPSAEEPAEPDEATPEAAEEGETREVIPRPQSWAADDQAAWDAVPEDVKPIIMARETERDRATQKAVQTASEARRQADAEVQAVTEIKAVLDQTLPNIIAMNQGKWKDWTPQAQLEMARTDPGRYMALKAEYDLEQKTLADVQTTNQRVTEQAFQAFVREERTKLAELEPELADAEKGASRLATLSNYLVERGAPPEQLAGLPAYVVSLAYDAYRYRQSRGHIATQAKTPAAAPRAALRPAAASTVRTPQREAQAAKNRFHQTGNLDDAIAFLNAKSG